jgi:queuine tRNA-ribosyltransferase
MNTFSFEIIHKDEKTNARAGIIKTAHGNIETPYLIPVATSAVVKAVDSIDLENLGVECTLANTYHLYLKPGDKIIKKLGKLHKFMNFNKPIFTDSGGFQAFSLGYGLEHNINKLGSIFPEEKKETEKKEKLAKITEKGVKFQSVYDGSYHFIDAKKSMEIQSNLGSDIIMAFDECTSPLHDYEYTKKALERTHKWALDSLKYHDKNQALYGIIQGGWFKDLRLQSAEFINSKNFEGIAIGGSLGKSKKNMYEILDWIIPLIDNRPRHLLGIGEIEDLFECVEKGIDTFDCVHHTRIARKGCLFITPKSGGKISNKFRINIRNNKFKDDKNPIDKNCDCFVCKNYSKAYLRHIFITQDQTYARLATIHNIYYMLKLMKDIRNSILNNSFLKLKKEWLN